MLRMVLKNGEKIKMGDNIIVKSMTEGRCELAIDAPKEIKIKRIASDVNINTTSNNKANTKTASKHIIDNSKK